MATGSPAERTEAEMRELIANWTPCSRVEDVELKAYAKALLYRDHKPPGQRRKKEE